MLSLSASPAVFLRGSVSKETWSAPWSRRIRVCCFASDDKSSSRSTGGAREEREEDDETSIMSEELEAQVARMLEDMDSQALLQDLNAAVERVARAKRELKALESEEQQKRAQNTIQNADTMVEECQRDVFRAELEMRDAEVALIKARAGNSVWGLTWEEQDGMDEDAERLESAKVGAASAVVGTMAGVPFFAAASLQGWELAVSTGFVFASCALFGLTYRYAIRRDLDNTQLKAGCVAAFSLVRGLGQVESSGLLARLLNAGDASQLLSLQGCLLAAESLSIFGFAAVALEYSFRQGLLRPFPLRSP